MPRPTPTPLLLAAGLGLLWAAACDSTEAGGGDARVSADVRDATPVAADAAAPAPDASAPPAPDAAPAPDVADPDAASTPDVADPDAAAPFPPDAALAPPSLGVIDVETLHAELDVPGDKGFLLIDVHTPYAGELPRTDANIVYTDTPELLTYIGPDRAVRIVLTCLAGPMSVEAGNDLVAEGYRAVQWLEGGMNAWEAAGYPLVHSP